MNPKLPMNNTAAIVGISHPRLVDDLVVNAVVHEPFGAHPSYVQGYYDRDNTFYLNWYDVTRELASTDAWLEEWVYGVKGRAEYVEKMGSDVWDRLAPGEAMAKPVNYGRYQ